MGEREDREAAQLALAEAALQRSQWTLARELMQTPVGDGPQTACPSFEYVAAAQFPPAT